MQQNIDENATIQHKYNKSCRLKIVLNSKISTEIVRDTLV